MILDEIRRVTSKQFTDRFGRWRVEAQREPIGVTNHGTVSAVLISAHDFEEFQRLKQYDTRRALHPSELDEELKKALEEGYQGKPTPELDHLLDE